MRAIVIDGFGGADRLHSAEMPEPVAAAGGEVLVQRLSREGHLRGKIVQQVG